MANVTVEVPEELAEAVRKVAQELEAGLAAVRSSKPLDCRASRSRENLRTFSALLASHE